MALAVLIATPLFLLRRLVVVTVDGWSMSPTYRPGDRLVVRRTRAGTLRRGQVVVFAADQEAEGRHMRSLGFDPPPAPGTTWLVKRIAAASGDPVPREHISTASQLVGSVVPPDRLVALGDNLTQSFDSRHYGYVRADQVLGVVVRRMAG